MGEEAMMIYNWIGNKAQPKEKFFGAIKSDLIDKEFREAPQTITINEGEESGGFEYVFKAYRDFMRKKQAEPDKKAGKKNKRRKKMRRKK